MTERTAAIAALLDLKDPDDLEPRVSVLTCEGDPDRFTTWADLPKVYVQIKRMERENHA